MPEATRRDPPAPCQRAAARRSVGRVGRAGQRARILRGRAGNPGCDLVEGAGGLQCVPLEAAERRVRRVRRAGRNPAALQAYLSCLGDHGVTVPKRTSTSTPASRPGGFASPLAAVRSNPKFAAANKICRRCSRPAATRPRRLHPDGPGMRKRLLLNGFLVLVVLGLAVGHVSDRATRSSSSAATTQTLATAKRGVVLQSVTSTGNVEAPTDLSLSFQQSGQVTRDLRVGRRACRAPARRSRRSTTRSRRWRLASAQAGLASAQASLAGVAAGRDRDRTPVRHAVGDLGRAVGHDRAAGSHQRAAERGEQRRRSTSRRSIRRSSRSTAANAGGDDRADRPEPGQDRAPLLQSSCRSRAHRAGESIAATLTRYRLDQVSCASHTGDPSYHPSDGVTCAQVTNLLTFAKSVQTAQTGVTRRKVSRQSAQPTA